MDRILLIILLYVIFGVIGPLIKRMQRQQQQPPKAPGTPAEIQPVPQPNGEAGGEKYFTRLQDAFQQPPELPPAQQETRSAFSKEKTLELLPPPIQPKPQVSTTYRRPVARRKVTPAAPQRKSLLDLDRRRGYMQGILMAEILGPPVSKRR